MIYDSPNLSEPHNSLTYHDLSLYIIPFFRIVKPIGLHIRKAFTSGQSQYIITPFLEEREEVKNNDPMHFNTNWAINVISHLSSSDMYFLDIGIPLN